MSASPMRRTLLAIPLWVGTATAGCGAAREGQNPGECSNGVDEDGDALLDCDDPDCRGAPDCQEDSGEPETSVETPDVPDANFDDVPELEDDTGSSGGVSFSKLANWQDVAAGVEHTCALRLDGTMACWGRPPTSDPREDVTVGLDGHWNAIASGQGFSCALDAETSGSEGVVACWGAPTYEATLSPSGMFAALSLGYSHGCVQDTSGTLDCWGWAGHDATVPPPTALMDFDLGYHFGCAVLQDGALTCWGKDLSNGNMEPPDGSFVDVEVGAMYGCALATIPGVATCWGESGLGQTLPPSDPLVAMSLGSGHGCGIRADSSLVCWGDDVHGQASPPDTLGWVVVSAGAHHTCAVDEDGWMACWGWNESERAMPPE